MNSVSYFVRLLVGEPICQPVCRYHPTCSQYAADALHKYGPIRGLLKAAWRIVRCNPWSHGGVDYA